MEANLKQFVFKWDAILDRLWPVDAGTIDQLHRELKELKAALALPTEPIRTPLTNNREERNSASEGFEVGFRAPEHPAISDEQIIQTLAKHGVGEMSFTGIEPFSMDGDDAPIFIAAYHDLLGQITPKAEQP